MRSVRVISRLRRVAASICKNAGAMMGSQAAKMIEITPLSFLQIGQHGAGSANRRGIVLLETETFQIVNRKLLAQRLARSVLGK